MKAGAIGAGRIMSVIGSDVKATAINCFVQPVGDAISGYDADGYQASMKLYVNQQKHFVVVGV